MGFITDIFTGASQADAAAGAAQTQSRAANKAVAVQERMLGRVRQDLEPFRRSGARARGDLEHLIRNTGRQRQFINQSPFFNALAGRAKRDIFNNAAARGKLGSGGTAEALQNSLVLLGSDLLNQRIGQTQNLVNMGANAAAGQATATQQTGGTIADLRTQQGNSLAAGQVGMANARAQGGQNLLDAAGTAASIFALSDRRMKEDIEKIGQTDNGLPLYKFRYIGQPELNIGVMAQDVEKVQPEAVMEIDGMKHVDYGVLKCH